MGSALRKRLDALEGKIRPGCICSDKPIITVGPAESHPQELPRCPLHGASRTLQVHVVRFTAPPAVAA